MLFSADPQAWSRGDSPRVRRLTPGHGAASRRLPGECPGHVGLHDDDGWPGAAGVLESALAAAGKGVRWQDGLMLCHRSKEYGDLQAEVTPKLEQLLYTEQWGVQVHQGP